MELEEMPMATGFCGLLGGETSDADKGGEWVKCWCFSRIYLCRCVVRSKQDVTKRVSDLDFCDYHPMLLGVEKYV